MPLHAGMKGKEAGEKFLLAPLLAMIGAGIPWLAYDQLISGPSDFWTVRGVVVVATAALGVISVALAWEICHNGGGKHETGGQGPIGP